jgi:hypothetical protein
MAKRNSDAREFRPRIAAKDSPSEAKIYSMQRRAQQLAKRSAPLSFGTLRSAPQVASTTQGTNSSVGTPTTGGPQMPFSDRVIEGPTSGPGAPLPSNTPNPAIIPDKPLPSYGAPSPMTPGYNTGAPATATFQGGTTGGTAGGMPGATGMPNTSMLPAGAAFKRGGVVRAKKMSSGGMTSKASPASKRGDGIAQRGKTKGRMV